MKRALVLSGGGSKGSYEVGVYKALKRLGIKFDIITGTSIGSLNGALFVTGDYRKAKKLWLTMSSSDIFGYDFEDKKSYAIFAKNALKNKGIKFDRAEEIMSKYINEAKIRKSKIDYGLVTYSVKNRVPKSLSKKDIPQGKMLSYIMASASCFPFVEMKKIDNDYYIDGGYYDNLPINLAIEMGAEEIIAVDLSAIGIKQKVKDNNVKIDYITTSSIKSFILDFTPSNARRNIMLGYNDAMKHFGKLDGNLFTFKKGHLDRNYQKISDKYIQIIKDVLLSDDKKVTITDMLKNKRYDSIFFNIKHDKSIEYEINNSIEYLGSLFDMNISTIYDINTFNRKILESANSLNYITVNKNLKGKMLVSYIYNQYINNADNSELYKKLFNIALVFHKDFLAALYLIVISGKYVSTNNDYMFFDRYLAQNKK